MNKRHYEHTLPNIRGSLSNTYVINPFKHPPTTRTSIRRSPRPASSTSPGHGNSLHSLSTPAGFPLHRIPFPPAVFYPPPRAATLCSRTHAPPGIAAACPARRYAQSISGNKTGFSRFSVPRPGLDKVAALLFSSAFRHRAHGIFAASACSTVSRPCTGEIPVPSPGTARAPRPGAWSGSRPSCLPRPPRRKPSPAWRAFSPTAGFPDIYCPPLVEGQCPSATSRHAGLRKIPVCRGIEPDHSVPYPSSLSLSALKSNSSSTA